MSNWRDQILMEFTPDVARLTLVADPDGLLLEEDMLAGVRERSFELIPFEDHVAFRYAYESQFRSRWDQGQQTDLVVVLRSAESDLDHLPYDLLQAGRRLSFSLGNIFPKLSYPIVATLDRGDLDALYIAQQRHTPDAPGDNATKDFILRYVFEISPETIREPSALLRVLLRRHYREQRIPTSLDERFWQVLHEQGGFEDWPLETIIPDREAFFAFLQERWPIFLDKSVNEAAVGTREDKGGYHCEYPGPADLPFDHDDIHVYIDNLFTEGLLEAVSHEKAGALSKTRLAIGIRIDEQADRARRIEKLIALCKVPNEEARHGDWFHFARAWAELVALTMDSDKTLPPPIQQKITALQTQIDAALMPWLEKRYAGLANLPPTPPVMLHHIPRFLSRHIHAAKHHKVAFVIMDGLALDQWIVIRKALAGQRTNYHFQEGAVFAWIPTITSVSRQAAFAGKPPMYFPGSINDTYKEPALWRQFWEDEGLTSQEVAYAKGLGDGSLEKVEEIVTQPKVRAVGLVVDTVDKIMHGMELGTEGMHNQVRLWAAKPFLAQLFDLLLENGFRICISSDHGNIQASGCGRPAEGTIADLRGERVRVYPDPLLRAGVKKQFPEALEWPSTGLPSDYLPLLAPARSVFIREGESLVGHGGAALEELIVPLVQIERKKA